MRNTGQWECEELCLTGDGVKNISASDDAAEHSNSAATALRTPPAERDRLRNGSSGTDVPILSGPLRTLFAPAKRVRMWFPILIFTILVVTIHKVSGDENNSSSLTFSKCCSINESILIDTNLSDKFTCVDHETASNNFTVVVPPLIFGKEVSIVTGKPTDCDELVMTEVSAQVSPNGNQCFDRAVLEMVNGTITRIVPKVVILSCATEIEESEILKIDEMRKCCPPGLSYDVNYHFCRKVDQLDTELWLIQNILHSDKYIYQMHYGLDCKSDEFSVELLQDRFSFSVKGSALKISRAGKTNELKTWLRDDWCVDREYASGQLVARGCTRDCSTFGAYCFRKCCPIGYHYRPHQCGSDASACVPSTSDDLLFNISNYLDPLKKDYPEAADVLGIKTLLRCPQRRFKLRHDNPEDAHHLAISGEMVTLASSLLGGPTRDYCIETFDWTHCNRSISVDTIMCFRDNQKKNFSVSFVTVSISCVFLFVTLAVYIGLPELRNLHGRTLICHVSMMLVAFCCLARVQYAWVESRVTCKLLGYGIYFGFISAFFWLNVMCFDIWWTFGNVRSVQPMRKASAERRRFAWYSLYAWSLAVLMTLAMLMLDVYPISSYLDSNIGRDICWFGSDQNSLNDWPHYIFFVIPLGIVTSTNFVLWVLTARYCHKIKSEVHRLQAGSAGDRAKSRFRADRARYVLTGKLWVVMGAGWVWELISTLELQPRWLWNIFDFINELQGVSIFLILVMKPKLYFLVRKKLGLEKTDARKNGTSSTARTSSTFLSRTISSDERNTQRVSLNNTADKKE